MLNKIQALQGLPIGSIVVPFFWLFLESYKDIPKKELRRSLWVKATGLKASYYLGEDRGGGDVYGYTSAPTLGTPYIEKSRIELVSTL